MYYTIYCSLYLYMQYLDILIISFFFFCILYYYTVLFKNVDQLKKILLYLFFFTIFIYIYKLILLLLIDKYLNLLKIIALELDKVTLIFNTSVSLKYNYKVNLNLKLFEHQLANFKNTTHMLDMSKYTVYLKVENFNTMSQVPLRTS